MKLSLTTLAALPLLVAAIPAPQPQADDPDPPRPSLPFTVKAWQPQPHESDNAKRIIDFTNVPNIEASARHFYTQKSGGAPSTYCPDQVGDSCPPGNETVIRGLSSLVCIPYIRPGIYKIGEIIKKKKKLTCTTKNTLVPGGQVLYVEEDGAVGFTQAHSTAVPPGAKLGGFTYSPGQQVAYWGYQGFDDGSDFMACPLNETSQDAAALNTRSSSSSSRRRAFSAQDDDDDDDGEDNGWPEDTIFQIFANFPEAVVPTGNLEDCFDFQAVVIDWRDGGAAAWQYV